MGFSLLLQPQNRPVAMKLLHYTLLMFTLPFLTFYLTLDHILPLIAPSLTHKTNYAVAVSVITVNLIIAGYVVSAFNEEDPQEEEEERGIGSNEQPKVGIWKKDTKVRTD